MLTHCATSTDELYKEYTACRSETLHPKISNAGVVMLHADGSVVMVYETGACPDEMAKWEKSHALREKRRREGEAYQAAVAACTQGTVLLCSGRGASRINKGYLDKHAKCGCVLKSDLRDKLHRAGY